MSVGGNVGLRVGIAVGLAEGMFVVVGFIVGVQLGFVVGYIVSFKMGKECSKIEFLRIKYSTVAVGFCEGIVVGRAVGLKVC